MSILAANNVFPHDPEDNWKLKTDKGGYEGTSQDLKNQIDELMSPDDILVRGAITKDGNKRIIAPYAFRIRIDQVEYTNPDLFETTIRTAAEGHYRIDIFVFTKFSTIVKIEGDEGIESAQEPDTPNDTIKIGFNSVFGSIINEPEIPVPDNTTVKKIESQDFIPSFGINTIIEQIDLLDDRSSISIIGSVTDIKSIQTFSEFIRPGKPFFIKNRTANVLKIWHYSGSGSVKFFFPNLLHLSVKPREVIEFNLNANDYNNLLLEFVGYSGIELGNEIATALEKTTINDNDKVGTSDSEDLDKTKYWKFSTIKSTIKTYFDGIYLGIANDQTVSGNKTFLAGKFGLRNIANTFTSFLSNSATASRTWTLQDRSGTLLDNTDLATINSSIATKQSTFTGSVNYLPKSINSTTLAASRIIDTGTNIGIDIVEPTRDIDFGNTKDTRIIGVHQSDFQSKGKNLTLEAGSTANSIENSNFNNLGVGFSVYDLGTAPNGDIYATTNSSSVYCKPSGSSTWSMVIAPVGSWKGIAFDILTGTVYIIASGVVCKRVNGVGNFIGHSSVPTVNTQCIACDTDGTLWAGWVAGNGTAGAVYKQINATGSWIATNTGVSKCQIMMQDPNGDIFYIEQSTGVLFKKPLGSDVFSSTGFNCGSAAFSNSGWIHSNGDMYIATLNANGNQLWKRTGRSGGFVVYTTITGILLFGVTLDLLGNIYAGGTSDIKLQVNNASGFPNLDGGTLSNHAGVGKGIGSSKWDVWTGQKTVSGTVLQVLTKRLEIDENGNIIIGTDRIFANNAAAISAGLPVRALYWTTTGEARIVV